MLQNGACDGIELLPTPDYLFRPLTPIAELSQQYNVPVASIHSPIYLMPYTPALLFNKILNMANLFPHVRTYVVHLSSLLTPFHYGHKQLAKLVSLASLKRLTLCFESNPIFPFLQMYPRETYDPKAFGNYCVRNNVHMVFDTSHISSVGGDVNDFYEKFYNHIKVIHLSDFKNGIEHLPLNQGTLHLARLLGQVKQYKTLPVITLEINTFPHAKTKSDKIRDILQSIQFVKKSLA